MFNPKSSVSEKNTRRVQSSQSISENGACHVLSGSTECPMKNGKSVFLYDSFDSLGAVESYIRYKVKADYGKTPALCQEGARYYECNNYMPDCDATGQPKKMCNDGCLYMLGVCSITTAADICDSNTNAGVAASNIKWPTCQQNSTSLPTAIQAKVEGVTPCSYANRTSRRCGQTVVQTT